MARPKRMILAPGRVVRVWVSSDDPAGGSAGLVLYNVNVKEVHAELLAFLKEQGYVHVDFLEPKEKIPE